MIEQLTVEELCARPGFDSMIEEYAKLAIKGMPKPFFSTDNYLPMESAGILTIWCAMYEGVVVGFASCIISKIPHYGVKIAIAESVFVRESVRRLGLGIRFLKAIELHALNMGVTAVFASCPIGSEYEKVLHYRNYSAQTVTYVKLLPCTQLV